MQGARSQIDSEKCQIEGTRLQIGSKRCQMKVQDSKSTVKDIRSKMQYSRLTVKDDRQTIQRFRLKEQDSKLKAPAFNQKAQPRRGEHYYSPRQGRGLNTSGIHAPSTISPVARTSMAHSSQHCNPCTIRSRILKKICGHF